MPALIARLFSIGPDDVSQRSAPVRKEVEMILQDPTLPIAGLSRLTLGRGLTARLGAQRWQTETVVGTDAALGLPHMQLRKTMMRLIVELGSASFLGQDLLALQRPIDESDPHLGIYIVTTATFQQRMRRDFEQDWQGTMTLEQVQSYAPYYTSAIRIPVLAFGLDMI